MAETNIPDAERAVLGALLLGGNASTELAQTILGTDPDVFFIKEHREIYRAIRSLVVEGNPVDPVTVTIRGGQQGASFSATYLSELTGFAPTTANAPYYAQTVKRASAARRLDALGGALAGAARKGDTADAQELARQIAELDCDCSATRPQFALDPIPDLDRLPETDWLFHELVPTGYVSMLTSQSGLGKSRMALGLAVSVVTGHTIWPSFVPRKVGHVLYLSAEDSAVTVGHRLKSYRDVHSIPADKWEAGILSRLHLQCESGCDMVEFDPQTRAVSPTPYFYAVLSWCRRERPALVVIDTLSDHAGGINENDNSQMKAAFKAFKLLAQASGGSVLVVHHLSKGSADPDKAVSANDVRGASSSVASSRAVFVARQEAGNMVVFLQKCNLSRRFGESWSFDLSSYALREVGVSSPPLMCRTPDILIPEIVRWVTLLPRTVRDNGADRENGRKSKLGDELQKKFSWATVGVVRDACRLAVKNGAVAVEEWDMGPKKEPVMVLVPAVKGSPKPAVQEKLAWEEPPYSEDEDGVPPDFGDEEVF